MKAIAAATTANRNISLCFVRKSNRRNQPKSNEFLQSGLNAAEFQFVRLLRESSNGGVPPVRNHSCHCWKMKTQHQMPRSQSNSVINLSALRPLIVILIYLAQVLEKSLMCLLLYNTII